MGYLGLVGGLDPCRTPFYVPDFASRFLVTSFWDSPWGINYASPAVSVLPYYVDPSSLEITLFPASAVTVPATWRAPQLVMDDTTMLGQTETSTTVSIVALTRSGSTLSFGGAQQTVAALGGLGNHRSTLARIDATHFARSYYPAPFDATGWIQFFSCVGGVVTLLSQTHFAPSFVAGGTGGSSANVSGQSMYLCHGASSNVLITNGQEQGVGAFGQFYIMAHTFTLGGGISSSVRTPDVMPLTGSPGVMIDRGAGGGQAIHTAGTNDYLVGRTNIGAGNGMIIWNGTTAVQTPSGSGVSGSQYARGDTPFSDYLFMKVPTPLNGVGSSGPGHPALISHSGVNLSETPITLRFLCSGWVGNANIYHTYPDGKTASTPTGIARHHSNVGVATFLISSFGPLGYELRAFAW